MTGKTGVKKPADDDIRRVVRAALREDIGSGDMTSSFTVKKGQSGSGEIVFRQDGIVAGLEVARCTWELLDEQAGFEAHVRDGDRVRKGARVARVSGSYRALLAGERTALNFLGRLSGIATLTSEFVARVKGTRAKILDTRKTTPGLRFLEKYAVRAGGGTNHRFGLYDMILIKENHINCAGGVTKALELVGKRNRKNLPVEIEVTNLSELREAVELQVDRIMLDNMKPRQLREAVTFVRNVRKGRKRPLLEASGTITLDRIRVIAETGVDFISIGALTHSPQVVDVSFLLDKIPAH